MTVLRFFYFKRKQMYISTKGCNTINRKEGVKVMEKSKKRIRTCLICVALAAVFIGIIYYYYSVKDTGYVTDGTLIASVQGGLERLTGYGIR